MIESLYTYSLIRSLYDKGESYIDSFWPLIVTILPEDGTFFSISRIQDEIDKKYKIEIPIHTLKTICRKALQKGFIEKKFKKHAVTEKGEQYVQDLEPENSIIRRINEFLDDARNYLNSNFNFNYTREDLSKIIKIFITENIEIFEQFLNPTYDIKNSIDLKKSEDLALVDYFIYVEQAKPAIFKTLEDIIYGSIISTVVNSEHFVNTSKNFKDTIVYLDSNILFGLLELDFSETNRPAIELFNLMKAEGNFKFHVFDFTLDEISNVLKSYQKEQKYYLSGIRVDSLHSSLKMKGWTNSKVTEFLFNLENILSKMGIEITPTDINIDDYEIENDSRRSKLHQFKPNQGTREQNHDLAAIELVKKSRIGKPRKIEESGVFFLTSDLKLAKFNYYEDKHKTRNTICEVIPDRVLTNILWIKKPKIGQNISLFNLLTLNTRQFYIDRYVWKEFFIRLIKLREDGTINEKDISILIYDKQIMSNLVDEEPDDIKMYTDDWFIDKIEYAKKRIEQEKNLLIKKNTEIIERDLKTKFKEQITFYEKEIDKTEDKIQEIVTFLKKEKEQEAKKITKLIFSSIYILIIFIFSLSIFYLSGLVIKYWERIEPIEWLVRTILSVLIMLIGIRFKPSSFFDSFREKVFNIIYNKKLLLIKNLEDIIKK